MDQYDISPNFSVFWLVQRTKNSNIHVNHRRTMNWISYEIENASLVDGAATTIFSGFQYFSRFLPQVRRYARLGENAAKHGRSVYVFGVPDVAVPPLKGIHYINLEPQFQLTREWFLVSYGESYFSALATEEVTEGPVADPMRAFKGIWTFELDLVTIIYEWLCQNVGLRTDLIPPERHDFQRQSTLMGAALGRMGERMNNTKTTIFRDELGQVIDRQLRPAVRRF
jgi:DICT domain-containing protein